MEDMTSKEYDVFFSYETSTSSELVRKLAEVLEGHGLKCWYAKNNITIGKWRKQIYEALDSCRVFILLLNRAASLSDEVDDEIENAIVLNRKAISSSFPFVVITRLSRVWTGICCAISSLIGLRALTSKLSRNCLSI